MNAILKPELIRNEQTTESPLAELLNRPVNQRDGLEILFDDGLYAKAEKIAKMMAMGKATVPKHLQNNEADCFAITIQAMQWGMVPFVVAQKTHLVNGTLGYEAQLVNAVVQNSGAITGSFHYEFSGTGNDLSCRVGAVLRGESEITWGEWLSKSSVTTQNSPLWKTNPSQQLGYLQVKNWARLYCPGSLLGIYSEDELEPAKPATRPFSPPTQNTWAKPVNKPVVPELKPAEQEYYPPEFYPNDRFISMAPKWFDAIDGGKKSEDDILASLAAKNIKLTELQLAVFRRAEGGPTLDDFIQSFENGELE